MRGLRVLLLCAWLQPACGDNLTVLPDANPVLPDANPGSPSLEERVDLAVGHIMADTCFAQMDTSACEWSNYEVGPDHFNMAASTGEAILVIDGFDSGMFPQLLRYRNRILGFYVVNDNELEATNPSMRLPRRLGDVLISFADPEFIPATLLARVGTAAAATYDPTSLLFIGHGGVIFSHLVELTPEQPLVLLDIAHLFEIPETLCQSIDKEALTAARARFAAIATSLRQVIDDHNVKFINASFGTTVPSLATRWSNACGTAAPSTDALRQVLHVFDPVYEALFNTPGVVTAQAAANLGNPADFPFDQVGPQYRNRVRIGFFSSLASGLDELGRGDIRNVEQFPRDGDADVYLNWNCEPFVGCADEHYEMAGPFGLSSFAVVLMSTSYVNPLGLGRLIHLRYSNHEGEAMDNELVETLEEELTPTLCGADGARPCVYQDPIAHRQLETYRLNYR